MFCTNCGSQFEEGNSFCPNCGSKVETVAQPVAAPAPVAAPVEAAPVQAAPVEAAPVQAVPVAAAAPYAAPVEPAPAPAPAPVATPVQPVAPVQPVQPVYAQATPVAPVGSTVQNDSLGKTVLVLGIVSVACCIFYIFSIAAIICGAIGLSKAKKFLEECGQLYGVAKVGKYLSLGGLIGGCVITGLFAFYFILGIISGVSQALS